MNEDAMTEDGKTMRQEAYDSRRALGYFLLAAILGGVLLAGAIGSCAAGMVHL